MVDVTPAIITRLHDAGIAAYATQHGVAWQTATGYWIISDGMDGNNFAHKTSVFACVAYHVPDVFPAEYYQVPIVYAERNFAAALELVIAEYDQYARPKQLDGQTSIPVVTWNPYDEDQSPQ